jgi:hypothetical protein
MPRTSVAIVCAMALGVHASAQQSSSTAAAEQLTALLQERQLDAIAARDPHQENRFVAALYVPASQLLVISSVHPQPAALDHRLAQRQYRDAYTDLHGSGVAEGRVFVMDLQANGLRRTREEGAPFDIVYRNGIDQMSYDGQWKQHKLTEREYTARFDKDEAAYARLLSVLADALQKAASTTEPPALPPRRAL